MKILIVDDEPLARSRLHGMLESLGEHCIVAEAANGKQAVEAVQASQPDIVLLDIRMPGMDGLEAAEHISKLETPPAIIFTTAYDDYALSAFKSHAIDYLLKPIRKEHLQQALHAASRLNRAQLQSLEEDVPHEKEPGHVSAKVKGDIILIPVEEIYFFMAEHKYVTLGYAKGEVLLEDALMSLEKKFHQSFLRVHRNALVATRYISSLEKDGDGQMHIHLHNCERSFEVSRRHLAAVRKFMQV